MGHRIILGPDVLRAMRPPTHMEFAQIALGFGIYVYIYIYWILYYMLYKFFQKN